MTPLCRALASSDTTPAIRREIPQVLARIGGTEACDALTAALIDSDLVVRARAMEALGRFVRLHTAASLDRAAVESALANEVVGHYRTYGIIGTLDQAFAGDDPVVAGVQYSMAQELDRIFILLGLLWPQHDLPSVLAGLRSDSSTLRANALELIDNVLTPALRKLIVPLVDPTVTIPERVARASHIVGVTMHTREEAVAALVASDDPWLKSCGVYAVGALRLTSLRDRIVTLESASEPLLQETVRAALARLDAGEAAPVDTRAGAAAETGIFTIAPDLGVG